MGEVSVEPLIQAFKNESDDIRASVAQVLGKIGDKRAVTPLIEALGDEDRIVRWVAAWALGKIGDKRAVDPLIQALEDEFVGVQEKAAEALGKIKDPKAVKPLIQVLKGVKEEYGPLIDKEVFKGTFIEETLWGEFERHRLVIVAALVEIGKSMEEPFDQALEALLYEKETIQNVLIEISEKIKTKKN